MALLFTLGTIAWLGLGALLGGWAQKVDIVVFGVVVALMVVSAWKGEGNRWRDEWRRGEHDKDFDEFP